MKKAVILAGGRGTRLYPITKAVNKHLLPINDKPMIYYPLSLAMLCGIKQIEIVTSPEHLQSFRDLFSDHKDLGIDISFRLQLEPDGIGSIPYLCRDFIADDSFLMMLGDNFFYGNGIISLIKSAKMAEQSATIFCRATTKPEQFGILNLAEDGVPSNVEEKPTNPKSNLAVTGLYYLDPQSIEFAEKAKKSGRGEVEIGSILNRYISSSDLTFKVFGRGVSWYDAGTLGDLTDLSQTVYNFERLSGFKIGCLEEISVSNGWASSKLEETIRTSPGEYYEYLRAVTSA